MAGAFHLVRVLAWPPIALGIRDYIKFEKVNVLFFFFFFFFWVQKISEKGRGT